MSKVTTLKITRDNKEKVNGFRDALFNQAQRFLNECLPNKIKYLDSILKGELFNVQDLTTLHAELNIPIPEAPTPDSGDSSPMEMDKEEKKAPRCGFLKENEKLHKIFGIVQPEIRSLREGCALIIAWLHYLIPKIEDGNDFGVSVQEKVLERVNAIKTKVETSQTNIIKYFTERGDAVAKASKETHVMDYRALVHEKDEAAFVELRLILLEVRGFYVELFDIILKNFEKIVNPKGEEKNPMY
ncbi:proteasome activator complex subunit 2 [Bombina bombina]|uniref:proteasome activator complex subunit 2 n=1 Tax=Bombina bombina TaxID=8345 RepID=UPI00235AE421|nr:proteasome activator complex subunit 2 [Bombina bombina]XP_053558334.1 proteasome activator complex subunit 2 [Bombina bombina]XP_053558335.1 proteasome activator complex subunit 2 [Bombina bombina]